jgi:hypothetical protein
MEVGRKRPTPDLVAEYIWKMQDASKREKESDIDGIKRDGLANTIRLVRQSINVGTVTLDQLECKVKELWPDRPIRSHLSRIIEAAASVVVPSVIELKKQEVLLRLHVPLDSRPASVDERERISHEHECDCGGTGLVTRSVPNRMYSSGKHNVCYRCRCPCGQAIAAVGDSHKSVTQWIMKYGAQNFLSFDGSG